MTLLTTQRKSTNKSKFYLTNAKSIRLSTLKWASRWVKRHRKSRMQWLLLSRRREKPKRSATNWSETLPHLLVSVSPQSLKLVNLVQLALLSLKSAKNTCLKELTVTSVGIMTSFQTTVWKYSLAHVTAATSTTFHSMTHTWRLMWETRT